MKLARGKTRRTRCSKRDLVVSLIANYLIRAYILACKETGETFKFLGVGMTTSAHRRTNIVAFLSVVILSAATMLWLFWHHPLTAGIGTIAVLGGFAISARLARWVDTEPRSDLEHKQGA